jgi:ribulose-phosphate 3-epimerase
MNKKVNPALLEDNFTEAERQVRGLEGIVSEYDIDVIDWSRGEKKTLPAVEVLKISTRTPLNFDLQMDDPRSTVTTLINSGKARQIIINLSSHYPVADLLDQIRKHHILTGVSLNPENKIADLVPYLAYCDFVQIMTIMPGVQGNPFIPGRLSFAMEVRDLGYEGPIGIDGGIGPEDISLIRQYPIDVLSVGSTLSKAENPVLTYLELVKAFNA